jgi:hypothetical protein
VGILRDYFEHFTSKVYWYHRELYRWLGLFLTFIMPILFGKFFAEAYKTFTTTTNMWSWNTWRPHWPIVPIICLWFFGYILKRYLVHITAKTEELYNALTWCCQDLETRKNLKKDIRCTIWLPLGFNIRSNRPTRLLQAIPYFPKESTLFKENGQKDIDKQPNGSSLRTFRVAKKDKKNGRIKPIGILGLTVLDCLSGDEPTVNWESFDSRKVFLDYMIDNWNFSEFQAKRLTSNRKSYLSLPIVNTEKKLLGILYFDSCRTRTFDSDFVSRIETYLPRFGYIITTL